MSAVTTKQLAAGVACYAEAEILPSLTGWQLWAAAAVLTAARQRIEPLIEMLTTHPAAQAIGVVAADGTVDTDALIGALTETAKTKGKLELDIPAIGKIKLGADDFETLRRYIEEAK